MKKFEITLPQPCHESWPEMTPTEQGRFCDQCAKEVIDFSKLSDAELIDRLQKTSQGCGRFTASQIQRSYPINNKKRYWNKAAAFLFPILLGSSALAAQTVKKTIQTQIVETKPPKTLIEENPEQEISIKGTVFDENQETIIGVTVHLDNSNIGAVSGIDGTFELKIPKNLAENARLSFFYVGIKSRTINVPITPQELSIQLESEDIIFEELVVTGGFSYQPQTVVSIVRNWWHNRDLRKRQRKERKQTKETDANTFSTNDSLLKETITLIAQ